jgi:hypothetical protein
MDRSREDREATIHLRAVALVAPDSLISSEWQQRKRLS